MSNADKSSKSHWIILFNAISKICLHLKFRVFGNITQIMKRLQNSN